MVCAWSHSFQRTIIGWLWQSLRRWPPRHCSVPLLPPASPIGLILDLRQNLSSTLLPPVNHHSYHCHCNQHHTLSTAAQQEPHNAPHMFHVVGHVGFCFSGYYHYTSAGIVVITAKTKSNRPIIPHMHQFSRIWVSILQHPSEYESFCKIFHFTTICFPR